MKINLLFTVYFWINIPFVRCSCYFITILIEYVGVKLALSLPPKSPVSWTQYMTTSGCSSWEHWLFFFFFYSFFLLLSERNSIKAQILLGIHLKWEMYSFATENVNAYKGRIAWWAPIWSLPSFNKYLISKLVSSSPLSTTVLEWNYFQANLDIVLEQKLAIWE